MSISTNDIQLRGFYVNSKKGLVREIWHISANGMLHWRSFNLDSGDPTGDSLVCSPWTLKAWADRAATPEEAGRMKTEYADIVDQASTEDWLTRLLQNVPAEMLFYEIDRRGLSGRTA